MTIERINRRLETATMIKASTTRVADGSYAGVLHVTPDGGEEPYTVVLCARATTRKEARWQADELRRAYIREAGLPQRQNASVAS